MSCATTRDAPPTSITSLRDVRSPCAGSRALRGNSTRVRMITWRPSSPWSRRSMGAERRRSCKCTLRVEWSAAELQTDPTIEVVSASAVRPDRAGYRTPLALTVPEIKTITHSYYDVTVRAIQAGFDGIEIHGANTYLPQQFVSPLTNHRTDEYARDGLLFIRELVDAVLKARGDARRTDFIVGYRFSPEEKEEGGLRLEHTFGLLDALCSWPIDYVHASLERYDRTSYFNDTVIVDALRNCVRQRKPLIGVGKIKTREDISRALSLGFDHLAMGTILLLNPDWRTTTRLNMEISEASLPPDIPPRMRDMLLKMFV